MKLAYIVRNSSVIPSSFNSSKNWREIILLNWLNTSNFKAKLLTTDFDHYALSKRKSIIPQFRDLIVQFKGIKYSKSVSLYRLFNAIYFGFNTFFYLALHAKRTSLIIVSLPTPESTLAVLFAAKLKKSRVFIDIRDNWPDNFISTGIKKYLFNSYVNLLNVLIFKYSKNLIWMSNGLYDSHYKRNLLRNYHRNYFLPITISNYSFINTSKYISLENKKFLFFCGTLNDQFNLENLHYLLKESDLHADYNFIIAGSGDKYSYFKQYLQNYKNVYFTGKICYSDVVYLSVKCAGFFLFYTDPSIYENHITNKIREFIYYEKPIFHNLSSSHFSLEDNSFVVGHSSHVTSMDSFLSRLNDNLFNNISDLKSFNNNYSNNELFIRFKKIINEK